jgi:hypothetical protein
MPVIESPNISANAGDPATLSDPNSPESIALRAQKTRAQSAEDQRYDVPPPKRAENFRDVVIVWEDSRKESREITTGLFLALGVLLFLYKAAPDSL